MIIQYEVDGSYETHDTSLPSTSACPYLPGQTVNMMVVPAEMADRKRSASLGSIRYEDFMTMDPEDKFSAPRRAPPPPCIPDFLGPRYRLPTAHAAPNLKHQRSDRSLGSGGPNWWSPRKLFTRKHSTSSTHSEEASVSEETSWSGEQRNSVESTSAQSAPSRTMCPEALMRFLSDGTPVSLDADSADRLTLSIPDDIAEEDDDDEFVVNSAISFDFAPKTILSPPPPITRHNSAPNAMRCLPGSNGSATTPKATRHIQPPEATLHSLPISYTFDQRATTQDEDDELPTSRFSFSSDEGSVADDDEVDPLDTSASANRIPSFYHSDAEEDDDLDCHSPPINFGSKRSGFNMGRDSMEQTLAKAFESYSLPTTATDGDTLKLTPSTIQDGEASIGHSPPLLALPVMDDFGRELRTAGLL
ncbi:unnamed protein product [Discula destructiva]